MTKFISAGSIDASEALNIYSSEVVLTCPVCASTLATIPENQPIGTRPMGLVCPNSQSHYLVFGDDAVIVREARERMKQLSERTGNLSE